MAHQQQRPQQPTAAADPGGSGSSSGPDPIAVLAAINEKRAIHGAPPLATYCPNISAQAQRWADTLARTSKFEHSRSAQYGENMYMAYVDRRLCPLTAGAATGIVKDAVCMWYAEAKGYDYTRPTFAPNTGHFTQLVWKGCKAVGAGVATDARTGAAVVVVNFWPPGNVGGRFAQNVERPSAGR